MLGYLLQKEFKQIKRNAFIPRLIVLMPLFAMIVFPYAANFDVKNINLSIVDHDKSSYSQKLIQKSNLPVISESVMCQAIIQMPCKVLNQMNQMSYWKFHSILSVHWSGNKWPI